MLSRLQTGVDAEVQKWQQKVDEKNVELNDSKKSYDDLTHILSKHGYEHDNLQTVSVCTSTITSSTSPTFLKTFA